MSENQTDQPPSSQPTASTSAPSNSPTSSSAPAGNAPPAASPLDAAILANDPLRFIELCWPGTRVYDKQANREALAADSTANTLLAFEDRPMNFDA